MPSPHEPMPLDVIRVPVLSDNYSWLVHDGGSGATMVIDPGEAAPVQEAAAARGWTIDSVWLTHWHPDHVGGAATLAAAGARVIGPEAEREKIAGQGVTLTRGSAKAIPPRSACTRPGCGTSPAIPQGTSPSCSIATT